jgi:L-amino acid N-acyltransferase YncA
MPGKAHESSFKIDAMQDGDWSQVRAIYGEGLATGLAAFMLDPPRRQDWDRGHLTAGRLVARSGDRVIGWAALAPVPDN